MKRLIVVVTALALALCLLFSACKPAETPEETFTVTFVQAGQENVVKQVKGGQTLTDIPTPKDRTGYTVVWEEKDLTNVKANITVNAVETANTYTITYVPGEGTLASTTQTVTYDSQYTLATPVCADETVKFANWKKDDGTAVAISGVWKIASNITLTAVYAEPYTITFVQDGFEAIVIKLAQGATLTEVPQPTAVKGHTVVWDVTDFSKITETATVTAIVTPNTYVVTYNLGILAEDSHASISETTKDITFGDLYNLAIPTCYGYTFVKWVDAGGNTVTNGTWDIDSNVTLTAVWEKDNTSDRWWTEQV